MPIKEKSAVSIDPSNFLRELKRSFFSAVMEEKLDIVSVLIADNVNSCLERSLSSKLLTLENKCFCASCNSCEESIKDTTIIQFALVLLIHLNHFCPESDKVIKEGQFFRCLLEDPPHIQVTHSNEVFFNNYTLVVIINHSGSLDNKHNWAIITDDTTNQWLSCNHKVVFQIKTDDLNNKIPYVLFFMRKNLFFMSFLCKGALEIETLSLVVTISHIIPDLYGH